jgi:glycosyltransferase involved in cell wall biosynthesis
LRLAVLQNIVAPTRHALFRALAERVDLTVFFMARTEPNRPWSGRERLDYPHRFLSGVHVPVPGRGDVDLMHVNPGVVAAIVSGRYDALLCGGWLSPTAWLALAACRGTKTRFVLWSGTSWPSGGSRAFVAQPLKRAIVGAADAYVAYGELARERLIALGAAGDRVTVATNTTGVEPFAQAASRRDGRPTVLWAGRFVARKRVDRVVALCARLAREVDGLRAVFVGDGPERARAQRLAREASLAAEFTGELPYERMPGEYARGDLLVTLAEREPWGLVVNEALAAGVPVLAGAEVPAARELVPAEAGLVSVSEDELVREGARLLRDREALARARAAARSVIPRLLPERWADAVAAAVRTTAGVP